MNFKKIIAGLCSCAMAFGMASAITSNAEADESGNGWLDMGYYSLKYHINYGSSEVYITGFKEQMSQCPVWIPEKIEGYPVRTITNNVFKDNLAVTQVNLSDNVLNIRNNTFQGCTNLRSVSLPKLMLEIGDSAFADCVNLEKITLPTTLKAKIGNNVFANTQWLEDMKANDPIVCVCQFLVDGTAAVGEVEVPESINYINDYAFAGNTELTAVSIHDNMDTVRVYAFQNCPNLEKITVYDKDVYLPPLMISDDMKPTIYGYTGSSAQTFAEKKELEFIPLDEEVETTTTTEVTTTTETTTTTTTTEETTITAEETTTTEVTTETVPSYNDAQVIVADIDRSLWYEGNSVQLEYTLEPSEFFTDEVKYFSASPTLATVSEDGVVTFNMRGRVTVSVIATLKNGKDVWGNITFDIAAGEPIVTETTTTAEETTTTEATTTAAPVTSEPEDELPETGYSRFYGIAQAGALMMIAAGAFVTLRKKED